MMRIGLIYTYYDNPLMLRRHLAEWTSYPPQVKERFTILLVDDASPQAPAATVIREVWGSHRPMALMGIQVMVNKPWGQDGARNIGMKETPCAWNLMTDMDHVLTGAGAVRMMRFIDENADRGSYYMPGRCRTSGEPYHSHPNTFLMHRDDFWEMGGYDEDFVGWYGSDGNFRKCARGAGLMEVLVSDSFKMTLFSSVDCPDANTRGLGRKESPFWAVNNPILNAKRMGPPYRAINPLRLPYMRFM